MSVYEAKATVLEDEEMINISIRPDRKLQKKVLLQGDYKSFPREGAHVEISITNVTFSNENGPCEVDCYSRYFKSDFDGKFEIGDADYYLDEDLEVCAQLMSRGEVNIIKIEYRDIKCKLKRRVMCKVQLLNTTNEEVISDWQWRRLYAQAEKYKERGVNLVQQCRILDAFRLFSKAHKLVVSIEPYDSGNIPAEHVNDVMNLKTKLLNNLAHCQLHFKEYIPAVRISSKVLEIDESNMKALYKRGSARIGLEEWEAAYEDLQKVIKAEPNNKEALAKMDVVKPKYRALMDNYTNVIKKMFG